MVSHISLVKPEESTVFASFVNFTYGSKLNEMEFIWLIPLSGGYVRHIGGSYDN